MPLQQILKIAGGYALVSLLYIMFSDWLLFTLFPNAANLQFVSMVKGWVFVILTASTLAVLLYRIHLRESRRYRALLDNHLAVMLVIDPVSGRILDASKAAEQFYGWPMHELRGKPMAEINTANALKIRSEMAHALGHDQSVFRFRHRLADGGIRDVDVFSGPIEFDGKTVLLSLVQDVTSLRKSTNEILRLNKLFALLSRTDQLIMHASSRQVLFDEISRIALDEGGFLFCWVGLVDENGIVKPVARAGKDLGYIDQLIITVDTSQKFGGGPTALALSSGKHVVSNDFLKDPSTEPWHDAARAAGIGASAALPFRIGGELIGILNFYAAEPEYFGAKEMDRLDKLAEDLSFGLDNLDRIQQLSTESEVIDSSPVVVFRWHPGENWPVEFVSQNVRRWGYSAASLMSGRIKFKQMVHPEDLQRVRQEMEKYASDKASEFTQFYRIVTGSGETRWVEDNTLIKRNDEGVINFYQGILTDITERKTAGETIQSYVRKLESAVLGTAAAVSQMVELRDPYTAGHERRVGALAAAIAAEMGLDENVQKGLQIAGAVHDVGKIVVPAEILTKPGRLSAAEFGLIKEHAEQGYSVLKDVEFPWPVAEVARQHHERLDGSGYPRGLKGDEILLEARIIAVADVVESMSSDRPYRPSKGIILALEEIEKGAGRLFEPQAVAACLKLFREKNYVLPE